MMERRRIAEKRPRQIPRRFRDLLPQAPPPLPLAQPSQPVVIPSVLMQMDQAQAASASGPSLANRVGPRIRRIFTTPLNAFGLSRRYEATQLPSYDPEEEVSLQDLSNIPAIENSMEPKSFYPFPNRTAFLLGDWHWNGGVQKSQAGFCDLIGIIGRPEFKPEDVQNVSWDQINDKLGAGDGEGEWEHEDAGWTRTPVTISVPYQPRRGVPTPPKAGPQNYTVDDFYHRSFVSVIREKVLGLDQCHQFHFEPYELLWQRNKDADPVRVQGELYTSPTFIDAHRELQNSPAEPGCDLPRVIIAMMF
jgi:hypothetical protein